MCLLKRLFCIASFILLPLCLRATVLSLDNGIVEITLDDGIAANANWGLDGIKKQGFDFSVSTKHLRKSFSATLTIAAMPGWTLLELVETSKNVSVGSRVAYRAINTKGREQRISGTIELFSVDVTIENINEADEEERGAKALCTLCEHNDGECSVTLLKVSFGCSTTTGELSLNFPAGELLVSVGTKKVAAQTSYPAQGIAMRSFWLHPLSESVEKCDHAIVVRHSLSGTQDKACYTSCKVDFVVEQENAPIPIEPGCLVDNHPATLRITYKTPLDGVDDFKFIPFAEPSTKGSLINHDNNFSIPFVVEEDNKKWKAAKVLWYGVLPDEECYTYVHAYKFILYSPNPKGQIEHEYNVSFPDEWPRCDPYLSSPQEDNVYTRDARSTSTIIEYGLMSGENNKYLFSIKYGDFIKTSALVLDATQQYGEEAVKEEKYHAKQWLGEVPTDKGGQGDCFTGKGIKYHIDKIVPTEKYYQVTANSIDEAMASIEKLLLYGEEQERKLSWQIWLADGGFIEQKAKSEVNYNAAWRYHCTYEKKFGSSPANNVHPAYK